MSETSRRKTYLKDYQPPSFLIDEVSLTFDLYEDHSRVISKMSIKRNPESHDENSPLILNGEKLKLIRLTLNSQELKANDYKLSDKELSLRVPQESFELEVETEVDPQNNHALEGLYKSGKKFCTQNESQGFRKITYYLDRPDVMAVFTTKIIADKKKYPVLLANGNPSDAGDLPEGRHFVVWKDPFPKPCYLFALVAGDLALVQDTFTTRSGRTIDLRIYVDQGNDDKCAHAMRSLKNAMKWDEETFGLECDLNTYMVVAVDDFNFGAMENKGLNIFNSQCALAKPQTATDGNYLAIESVIGHEYFHNWTGNRVTCRDWFQITLKEGLTVFRDQEFSADMGARSVNRISEVRVLRDYQFVEDAGPNAHPVKPAAYLEINNFYTVTIYEKGTEVIRMIHTLIGRDQFRKGITKYFELFDGKAVTTEDFVHAMELASGKDLTQFKNWYYQPGTPECRVSAEYDADKSEYRLTVEQGLPKIAKNKEWDLTPGTTPPFDGESDFKYRPFHFPLAVGLLGPGGEDLIETKILEVTQPKETFVFSGIKEKPMPSLLRNFSAPVLLHYDYSAEDLRFIFSHDTDDFNRYEAGQRIATIELHKLIEKFQKGLNPEVDPTVLEAFGIFIKDTSADPAFKAEALTLPSVTSLTEVMTICDFEAATEARDFLVKQIAENFEDEFKLIYENMKTPGQYSPDAISIGKRSLKGRALAYLIALENEDSVKMAEKQFSEAENMTDEITALSLLCQVESEISTRAKEAFFKKWKGDALVMNKWFVAQASSKLNSVFDRVKELETHPAFDIRNPNKIRSLFGVFSHNLRRFHDAGGAPYQYLADKILQIDEFNPSAASHLASAFGKFGRLPKVQNNLMKQELSRILDRKELSPNTFEIVSKTYESGLETSRKEITL